VYLGFRKRVDLVVRRDLAHGFRHLSAVAVKKGEKAIDPGANTTTSIYNTSVVIFYNATCSLARFEEQKILHSTLKNALAYYLQRRRCM
jgi:hypothetical protein